MKRRHFLAAAAAALPALPAVAAPARAADFARSAGTDPMWLPFKGVDDAGGDLDCPSLLLRGRWPAELQGRFYRNGPALYERSGERYHHWFDGDGMVQQFTLGGAGVAHRGRLVRTRKLMAERDARRFLFSALGTSIEGRASGTGADSFNVANTNALEHGGRLLALWEGGSAYALDQRDLSTQGPVTWRPDLQGVPFSAHPKVDAAGHLWNIGNAGAQLVVWHLDPRGALAGVQLTPSPFPGGMVHDIAVTARRIVVPLPPVKLHFEQPSVGPRRFAMEPGQPLRVLVMDKDDITRQRIFELPPSFIFHVGHAHDTAEGVELSFVASPDASFLDQGAVALMSAQLPQRQPRALVVARLDLASGRVQTQAHRGELEFPRTDPRRIGERVRWLVTTRQDGAELQHAIQLLDLASGRTRGFDYGAHVVAEEHILVPKPGGSGELDAWLLGTTYDARRRATVLNLLDAAHVEDGPIAQAVLPYLLPLGFHGNFSAA